MKRALIVALFALVIVFAGSQSAFALHGGYSTTSISCGDCHSVHNGAGSQNPNGVYTLFPNGRSFENTQAAWLAGNGITSGSDTKVLGAGSTTEDLCEYCHVYEYSTSTSRYVYKTGTHVTNDNSATVTAIHAIGATDVPESSSLDGAVLMSDGVAGLNCVDCHNALPHAAGYNRTSGPTLSGKKLYSRDASVMGMCVRCHDVPAKTDGTQHMMTTQTAKSLNSGSYGTQQIAWSADADCTACHANSTNGVNEFHSISNGNAVVNVSGVTTATASVGVKFTNWYLVNKYGNTEISDGLCLSCHQNGTATAGVSVTY